MDHSFAHREPSAGQGVVDSAAAPGHADDDGYYQALLARDARFDGRLFIGVRTTGIYCRPICRVRAPRRENCRFFDSAARAEAASFRPCLKCRPEIAPQSGSAWSVMDASRTLACQAAALLDEVTGDADASSIAALARRLGISERHLRRIFLAEHGVSPLQYLQTRRLLLAKQLLTDSRLPVAQVALASGFGSVRRFNAAFAERYRMAPARLRATGSAASGDAAAGITVRLAFREPIDRERLLAFIDQRAIPGVEAVDARGARRTLRAGALAGRVPNPPGWLQVGFETGRSRLALRFSPSLLGHSTALLAAVRRWFDLDAQPALIDEALRGLPGEPGQRLPGCIDGFELAVRAVLGQQVSVAAARTIACRLVAAHGEPIDTPWPDLQRSFPAPARLAAVGAEAIAAVGIIRSRATAIAGLALHWAELQPLTAAGAAAQPLIDALCELPGIGPWTAHYVAMRALGWPDAFPPGDVAVQHALRALGVFGGPDAPPLSATALRRAAEAASQAWRPWRSYAVLRLWTSLADSPGPTP